MRELRRSFGVLGEAQWFLGFGRGRGREAGSKNGFLLNSDPQYYGGAVPQRAILLVAASCKNGTFQFGVATGRSQYK